MPAANVTMVIDQGEDFTTQIIWTDEQGTPQPVVEPIRMDIRGAGNQALLSLSTPETELPDGAIPEISFSTDIGMIQIHIPRTQTAALPAGTYNYDLFASVSDDGAYAGDQQMRLLVGQVVVNKRITEMF